MTMHHTYTDMAHLNARYQGVPLRGVGGSHSYLDVSKLNAPYAFSRLQGLGLDTSDFTTGAIIGRAGDTQTAQEAAAYPWREYSAQTQSLQQSVNQALNANGYCPISTDGKLGPATCGAVQAMLALTDAEAAPPVTCQSFTSPSRQPCGGGGGATPVTTTTPAVTPTKAGMSGDTMWLIGGAAVAVVAVGTAYYVSKKKALKANKRRRSSRRR